MSSALGYLVGTQRSAIRRSFALLLSAFTPKENRSALFASILSWEIKSERYFAARKTDLAFALFVFLLPDERYPCDTVVNVSFMVAE